MRPALRAVVTAAALAAVLAGGSAPVHADESRIPDVLPEVSAPDPADFAEAALELPEGLVAAVERDLGLGPAEYLAEAQAANDAADVVTALIDAGIDVNGGEYADGEVIVYVDSADDVPAVESTGATAVVGQQDRSEPIPVEAVDDLYGGEGWGYSISGGSYLACSIGFPGYNANGDDVLVTAGHCFGMGSGATVTTQYDGRAADPRSLNRSQPSEYGGSFTPGDYIGTLVPGSKEFGNGRDAALLTTGYSAAVLRPQVAQWGSTGFGADDLGAGGALATSFRLTGTTPGIVGAPICKSGARTGWTCGEVLEVDWNVDVSGQQVNTIKSGVCVLPGDSGGVAVIGTEALGITSGGNHLVPSSTDQLLDADGDRCADDGYYDVNDRPVYREFFSVFFHLVDPGLDDDDLSVDEKYGAHWTLCTGPVPFVASLAPGGDPDGPAPLRGKTPCAVAGETTVVELYLDGSPTPYATRFPSGSAGSFEFPLDALPVGDYDYELVATSNGVASPQTATGIVEIVERSDLPGRLAGADRYATAAAIAGEWDQSFDASTVFVATGENYPDALSAAAAAAYLGAPVLLTQKDALPAVVKQRLDALHPDRIIVLGSTASVSSVVLQALQAVAGAPTVQRIAGSDRYDTARKVIEYAFKDGAGGLLGVPSVVIATGRNFPDALSAAPAVARDGGAVILVDGSESSIPSATLSLIDRLDPDRIVIAGSTKSVKKQIETQLEKRYGADVVSRVAGSDRYQTSRLLTDLFWGDAPAVFFAVGSKFPDALAGAALAGALGSPLLVTEKSCMSSATRSLAGALDAEERVLLGSSAAITDSVASLKVC